MQRFIVFFLKNILREELCEIIMQGVPPNISTSSESTITSTTTSTTSLDSAQELIRAIALSTVTILNDKISKTDRNQTASSREQLIGTRTSLQRILSSDDSICSNHSSFILEVFNENRDSNTLIGVAGVIGCLYFRLQELIDASPDQQKDILTDADLIEFIRDCQISLSNFHRQVCPDDLPDDLKIYHLKIRNIDKLLTWWLRNPYPIGKSFYSTAQFTENAIYILLERLASTSLRCSLYG